MIIFLFSIFALSVFFVAGVGLKAGSGGYARPVGVPVRGVRRARRRRSLQVRGESPPPLGELIRGTAEYMI